MDIHQTAVIGDSVKIGANVSIGAYAVVGDGVEIADNTVIESHACLRRGARIGANCNIGSFAVISGEPQDLHFDPSIASYVEIGSGTTVREGATIHRATVPGSATKIGKNCLIMATSHIGHDCSLGDNSILANFSAMAGWVKTAPNCFISGGVMLHQKIRVGEGVIVSGNSAFSLDIPPFVNAYGRNDMTGLNIVGLVRRKVSRDAIAELKELYAFVFSSFSVRKNALYALDNGMAKTPEGLKFLDFFRMENRHYLHPKSLV